MTLEKDGDFEGNLTSQWSLLVSEELFVLYVEAMPVCGEGVHRFTVLQIIPKQYSGKCFPKCH